MIRHRCPWCGEKIPFHVPIKRLLWQLVDPDVCSKCKKPYTSNSSWSSIVVLAAGLIGAYIIAAIIKETNISVTLYWLLGIAGLILLAIVFVELCRIPYARDVKKKEILYTIPKSSADINLSWEKHDKEGLLLPRFQVLNGEIFPACFMDADGTPISTAFCVVLNDFFWSDNHHCSCKVHFVLDDAPEEKLFRKRNQFYLYYNCRKIAKGAI